MNNLSYIPDKICRNLLLTKANTKASETIKEVGLQKEKN